MRALTPQPETRSLPPWPGPNFPCRRIISAILVNVIFFNYLSFFLLLIWTSQTSCFHVRTFNKGYFCQTSRLFCCYRKSGIDLRQKKCSHSAVSWGAVRIKWLLNYQISMKILLISFLDTSEITSVCSLSASAGGEAEYINLQTQQPPEKWVTKVSVMINLLKCLTLLICFIQDQDDESRINISHYCKAIEGAIFQAFMFQAKTLSTPRTSAKRPYSKGT